MKQIAECRWSVHLAYTFDEAKLIIDEYLKDYKEIIDIDGNGF